MTTLTLPTSGIRIALAEDDLRGHRLAKACSGLQQEAGTWLFTAYRARKFRALYDAGFAVIRHNPKGVAYLRRGDDPLVKLAGALQIAAAYAEGRASVSQSPLEQFA